MALSSQRTKVSATSAVDDGSTIYERDGGYKNFPMYITRINKEKGFNAKVKDGLNLVSPLALLLYSNLAFSEIGI